jgi:hypothetical protein
MNVLILTPDSVGSTLLQRVLTIYMQFNKFDKPVINLHELTNGLEKYHNTEFKIDAIRKPLDRTSWGFYQSLDDITTMLKSVNHYTVARVAQYHMKNRGDSLEDQLNFYRYLNDNYYIISCRRDNVLEQALSWALRKVTKKTNVYSADEKFDSFSGMYKDPINVDIRSFVNDLNNYKEYIEWCDKFFDISSFFVYEEHTTSIDDFIMNLPIFKNPKETKSWEKEFDQSFNDWNKCRYLHSDVAPIAIGSQDRMLLSWQSDSEFVKSYENIADETWPTISSIQDFKELPQEIIDECITMHHLVLPLHQSKEVMLPEYNRMFLDTHADKYFATNDRLQAYISKDVMYSLPPIKKYTLLEKIYLIKNFQDCLNAYNDWIIDNPTIGQPINVETLKELAGAEINFWKGDSTLPSGSFKQLK